MTPGIQQKTELSDSRRLTGPNLFSDYSGAIIDVCIEGVDARAIIESWQNAARALLNALDWNHEQLFHRQFEGGASLVLTAPIDCLYAATEINETAWQFAVSSKTFDEEKSAWQSAVDHLRQLIADERNEALLQLQTAAAKHEARFLWDDDIASVGSGRLSYSWVTSAIPQIGSIAWNMVGNIPIGLVTGTNGKSTTVRLTAAMAMADGIAAGLTSTDDIRIGDHIINKGDYSGPGGARTLIRHADTELAILEVARGGLLRRGLAVDRAEAAVITNVAADHLGEYGINTVDELAQAKFIVHRVVKDAGILVLNADDEHIVARARYLDQKILWFSTQADSDLIEKHCSGGGMACVVDVDDYICFRCGNAIRRLSRVNDVPITLNGAARHNVQNALAASALAHALRISDTAIQVGLQEFSGDRTVNPGRGNYYEVDGIKILFDFAHNAHGMDSLVETCLRIEAKRRLVMLGHAGDRRDREIIELTESAARLQPDRVITSELGDYLRGRAAGEIPALIRSTFADHGIGDEQIIYAENPVEGTRMALEWAQPGDLLLLCVLSNRDAVFTLVERFIAKKGS